MKVKVICQFCGKKGEVDIEKDEWGNWMCWLVEDLVDSDYLSQHDIWESYPLWFCDDCMRKYSKGNTLPADLEDMTDEFIGKLLRSLKILIK